MKATWNNTVIAQAPKDQLISIEGNWYFPPDSLKREFVTDSDMSTICFWKGEANYYNLAVEGQTNDAAAWYYATPKDGSIDRVGRDFTNYVAFWRGVEVSE